MKNTIKNPITLNLLEEKHGLYLVRPHGEMLWKGNKTLIVKSKLFKNAIGRMFYVLDKDLAYGIIKIGTPYKIDLEEFEKLKEEHRVTDEERKKWWPDKQVLFAYPFKKIEIFKNSKKVKIPKGTRTFIEDFEVVDVKKLSDNGKLDLKSYKLLEDFKDMTIIKDFVSVIGSYAEQKPDYTPNDIDLLVRMAKPNEYIKRAVEVRILKMLGWPEDWAEKIHFVWGDPEGPHDTYVPLYDLMLKRQLPMKKIEMIDDSKKWVNSEEYKELNLDFYPMKPGKRFYDVNEALKYMFVNGQKYAIEKKYNGFRGILEKRGDSVKLFSDERRDISRNFPTILSQARKLSSKDFIVDGELVLKGGGRSEIAKFITGKMKLDDSDIQFHAFDVMKLDKDVANLPWHERKSLLHSLNYSTNIKEVRSIIVLSADQARKAINLAKGLPKSEGALIKVYDGKYSKGKTSHVKSNAWIKYRIEDPIDVMILEISKKVNGFSYNVGIHVKGEENKFNPKYLVDTPHGLVLKLGNTFVTKEKFDKYDYITINVEEVWRHEYPKQKKIRYSIHKPTVMKVTKGTDSWKRLDDLAVSKGELVVENLETVSVENFVVKRGNKWCVVHGHPKKPGSKTDKPKGTVIKCFPTKTEADRMHKAIIISKIRRGKLDDTTTVTPGVSEVQGTKIKPAPINKGEQIFKFAEFDPKSMIIDELKNKLLEEAKNYNLIKKGERKGSLEKTVLVGRIVYNELMRRGIKVTLPKDFDEFMDIVTKGKTGIMVNLQEDDFGETRTEAAKAFWDSNWHNMYPKDGKGKFVMQNHWRGLTEEEAKSLTNTQLLNTDHSVHSDLRWEVNPKSLAGFTVFLGTAKDNKAQGGNKLVYQSKHKTDPSKLRGSFKLEIPHSWLNVGKGDKGTVSPPRGIGATGKKWAKFFIEDSGTFELGIMREHAVELFINGKNMKGRMLMQYVPLAEGKNWLIDFPKSQKPFIETHDKEDTIRELKNKNQRWLIWSAPGMKPEKIDVKKYKLKKKK